MSIYQLVIEALEKIKEFKEKEKIVKVAGGRGYSPGKIYTDKTVKVSNLLGTQKEKENQVKYIKKPVKISKAFKKEKK